MARQQIEVLNGIAKPGDRLAVAVGEGRSGGGMRVGEIQEILDDGRVKVLVDQSSGFAGKKFNYELNRWEFQPFTKTYQGTRHMVKLEVANG